MKTQRTAVNLNQAVIGNQKKRLSAILAGATFALVAFAMMLFPAPASATPSTQIWIPSTDIQAKGTAHLGIDNYFSGGSNSWSAPTDVGLELGLGGGWEAGIDLFGASHKPLYFNFKYGIPETDSRPALAAGSFFMGTSRNGTSPTNYDMFYVLGAKTIPNFARLSLGMYSGSKLLVDASGAKERTGILASLDKQITKKVWAGIDYQGGDNVFGATGVGASYSFADNVSVIFGYVFYNENKLQAGTANTFTTQLDINF